MGGGKKKIREWVFFFSFNFDFIFSVLFLILGLNLIKLFGNKVKSIIGMIRGFH